MRKAFFLIILFIISINSFASDLLSKKSVDEYFLTILDWPEQYWPEGRSSALIEKNYDRLHYEQVKICDDDLSTAWVEGVSGNGIGEWVVIIVDGDYQNLSYKKSICTEQIKYSLKINNGYCKNNVTYTNNNRLKKAKITIYEVPLCYNQTETIAIEEPFKTYETEIELCDSNDTQKFDFIIKPKAKFSEGFLVLFTQLTILEVYPGEKYHDTCISEMHATAEVVKEQAVVNPSKRRNKNRWQK